MSVNTSSLAKVSVDKVELAMSIYTTLGAKAEQELYAKIESDHQSSGITHVGFWKWKKEVTTEMYLDMISDSGHVGAMQGNAKVFNKYKGDMKYAPKYYYVFAGRLTNQYYGTERAIKSLLKARDSEYLYLDYEKCAWVTDMLAVEEEL